MSEQRAPPRLRSDQVMTMYLDEIAGRLADQIPEGLTSSETITIGTEWVELAIGAWMAADIWNDGDPVTHADRDVYVKLGNVQYQGKPWDNNEAPIKKGEHIRFDLKSKRNPCPPIIAICQSNTAALRVHKLV